MPQHDDLTGVLKCYVHEVSFDTPTEFYEHERTVEHTNSGEDICIDCKNRGVKTRVKLDPNYKNGKYNTVCPECHNSLDDEYLAKLEREGKIKVIKK